MDGSKGQPLMTAVLWIWATNTPTPPVPHRHTKRRAAPGAPPRLSEQQRFKKVPELLQRGAEAHGFRGEAWRCERVAEVIPREFGVSYHPAHVSRLLKDAPILQ
jgi:transposase